MNENTLDPKKDYPQFGWELVYCTKEEHTCEYCGTKIMYRFFIRHDDINGYLVVGSDCVNKLTSDEDICRDVSKSRRILEDVVDSYTKFCKTFKTTRKGNSYSRKFGVAVYQDIYDPEQVFRIFYTKTGYSDKARYYTEDSALEALWSKLVLNPNKIRATLPWNATMER